MGVGEASGMFPIDSARCDYDETMVQKFNALTGIALRDILPKVLTAGEKGGTLTETGARFLDPSGTLRPGVPVAPCEGDAGTGMAATKPPARATPAPAWRPPTPSVPAPATCPPAPPTLP